MTPDEGRFPRPLPKVRIEVQSALQREDLSVGLGKLGFDVCFAGENGATNEVVLLQEELDCPINVDTPILVIGQKPSIRAAQTALTSGASGYFAAPFDFLALATAICASDCQARASAALNERVSKLQESLQSDQMVSTVVGILMERFRLQRPEAYSRLRQYARKERRKIVELANELITATEELGRTMRALNASSTERNS